MLPLYRSDAVQPKYYKNWLPHATQHLHLKGNSQKAYVYARLFVGLLLVCGLVPLLITIRGFKGSSLARKTAYTNRFTLTEAQVFPVPNFQNLVLVAGHAVYVGHDYATAANESSWYLEDYQKVPGQAQSFLDHIRMGISVAAEDANSMLLFSGGQTRHQAGPRSEGLSYWQVADSFDWFGSPHVRESAFTEEHARDSFENLLFGLCRFYELTGHYPTDITVVSYTLKRARFEDIHRAAVRFPAEHFHFVGTPVPEAAVGAAKGEAATVEAYRASPYGCTGGLLQKRLRRDPFAVGQPHPSRCPDMAQLLQYCQPTLYTGPVPWGEMPAARKASRNRDFEV